MNFHRRIRFSIAPAGQRWKSATTIGGVGSVRAPAWSDTPPRPFTMARLYDQRDPDGDAMKDTMQTVTTEAHPKAAAVFIGLLGALAGLMFGLDIGVISGAEQILKTDFGISDTILEHIVSWMMLGAAVGALAGGWMAKSLGRKRSLLLGSFIFVEASVMCGLAGSVNVLLAGRLILGVSIGM